MNIEERLRVIRDNIGLAADNEENGRDEFLCAVVDDLDEVLAELESQRLRP